MKILILSLCLFMEGDSIKVDTAKVDTVKYLMEQQAIYIEKQKAVNSKMDSLLKKLKDPEIQKKIKARIKK